MYGLAFSVRYLAMIKPLAVALALFAAILAVLTFSAQCMDNSKHSGMMVPRNILVFGEIPASIEEVCGLACDSEDIPWEGLVVYDLNEPAFDAGDLAEKAARVFLGCEVWAWVLAGNAPKDAVGAAGERGAPQIHPSWRQKMAGMGLDFEVERDRWTFAIWLVENSGWQNWWVCQHSETQTDGTSGEY